MLLETNDYPTPVGPSPTEMVTESITLDAEEFLQIDRAKLEYNFERLDHAKALITGYQMNAAIDDLAGVTDNWQGSAADAFQEHVSHIRTFTTDYLEEIGRLQLRLVETYQLALLARRDYHTLQFATKPSEEFVGGDSRETIVGSYRDVCNRLRAWLGQDMQRHAGQNFAVRDALGKNGHQTVLAASAEDQHPSCRARGLL